MNYNLAFTTFLSGPIQRFQDFRDQWQDPGAAIPLQFTAHLDATCILTLVAIVTS
jgi:D-alanyl-lipoteichoic acid acyltransferase DltB (MBOAT superfamily)